MSTDPAVRRRLRLVAVVAAAALVMLTLAAVGRLNAEPSSGGSTVATGGPTGAGGDPRTIGAKAPGLTAKAVDGRSVVLPDGRPAVLFFFATNCATCVVTAKAMAQLDRTLADRVSFVAIDLVPTDDRAVIDAFRSAVGDPAYPIVVGRSGEFLERYAVMALDTTLVIDADGTLTWRSDGRPLDQEALRSALRTAGVAA